MSSNKLPQPVQPTHSATPATPDKLLRLPQVQDLTGFGKSSIYTGVKKGTFPAPYRLSARCVGWKLSALQAWIDSRTPTQGGAA
ncbi:helix-turn-helix transcriptional regulator [Rhodoferax sp.]|uniref:helix-turn-helix transcriptional regulator n=1 Tax=Rhodoferax sp. TaxID=50421 RepID=UPI00345C4055